LPGRGDEVKASPRAVTFFWLLEACCDDCSDRRGLRSSHAASSAPKSGRILSGQDDVQHIAGYGFSDGISGSAQGPRKRRKKDVMESRSIAAKPLFFHMQFMYRD
jgi:hypothetical protein